MSVTPHPTLPSLIGRSKETPCAAAQQHSSSSNRSDDRIAGRGVLFRFCFFVATQESLMSLRGLFRRKNKHKADDSKAPSDAASPPAEEAAADTHDATFAAAIEEAMRSREAMRLSSEEEEEGHGHVARLLRPSSTSEFNKMLNREVTEELREDHEEGVETSYAQALQEAAQSRSTSDHHAHSDSDASAHGPSIRQTIGNAVHQAFNNMRLSAFKQSLNSDAGLSAYTSGLRIWLKGGDNLQPPASASTTDPFVVFSFDKNHTVRSDTAHATLNPRWNQELFLPMPSITASTTNIPEEPTHLRIMVYHRGHIGRTTALGGVVIDITTLEDNTQWDLDPQLSELDPETYQVRNNAVMGFLSLTVTRIMYARKNMHKHRKAHRVQGSRMVSVDVIKGRDMLTGKKKIDTDPSLLTYVRFSIGKHSHRTKAVTGCDAAVWRQRVELPLHDESQLLQFSVFRKITFGQDELVGTGEVDLFTFNFDYTYEQWVELRNKRFGGGGELHVLITICDLFNDEESVKCGPPLALRQKASCLLYATIHRARNLAIKDLVSSDPWVLLEVGTMRLRTSTISSTLAPEWEKKFVIILEDVFDVLTLTVFDEDDGGRRNEHLGALQLPLPLILSRNGIEKEWIPLKHPLLLKSGQGEIQVSLRIEIRNQVKTYKQLIKRRVDKHMHAPPKFKPSLLSFNITRTKAILLGVYGLFKTWELLVSWHYGWKTIFAMAIWTWACLHMQVYHVTAVLLGVMLYQRQFNEKSKVWWHLAGGDDNEIQSAGEESSSSSDSEEDTHKRYPMRHRTTQEDIEAVVDSKKLKKVSGSPRARLLRLLGVLGQAQDILDKIASFGERVKNLFCWSMPLVSWLVFAALVLGTLVLYLVPLRWLLLAWGWKKFVRKGLRKYQPFGLFVLPRGYRPLNEALELVGRVPSDVDLARWERGTVAPSPHSALPLAAGDVRSKAASALHKVAGLFRRKDAAGHDHDSDSGSAPASTHSTSAHSTAGFGRTPTVVMSDHDHDQDPDPAGHGLSGGGQAAASLASGHSTPGRRKLLSEAQRTVRHFFHKQHSAPAASGGSAPAADNRASSKANSAGAKLTDVSV
eukprot:m.278193 g.278193  ORF g.278193 m.278193 type:complete len:1090 (-) comp22878_c1_seq4:39-3308(-)